jgi:hypothetical protein
MSKEDEATLRDWKVAVTSQGMNKKRETSMKRAENFMF